MGKNVAVFVDVANIFYAAKAAGVDIDYVTLLKAAIAGRDFVRAYAYTGLDPENENQRNFHSFLARHGYKVVSKDIRKYGDGKVKANLDIELVVDMMKTARNLDVAIVISGDGDFAPAIRAVQEMGVRVEVISFRGNTSSDLIEVADIFTDITQLAKVERGSRSGRRVAEEEFDMSLTEIPDKQTEGTGTRQRRGRGRGRGTFDELPARGREPAAAREALPGREAAAAVAVGGVMTVLPGEKLSRVARPAPSDEPFDDIAEDEELAEPISAELPALAADADGGEPRRRRRRGGRGRGRGRGRAEEGLEVAADSVDVPEFVERPERVERVERPQPVQRPMRDLEDEEPVAPRGPRPTPFGSVWDSQLGMPTAPAAGLGPLPDDEEEEPEIPEYLLAERRRGTQGVQAGRGRSGPGGRGVRAGYSAAMDRERYGRGGLNRYGEPQGQSQSPSHGRSPQGRPQQPQPQPQGRPPQGRPQQPRRDDRQAQPVVRQDRQSRSEEWSEVPPEIEEMLRAQIAARAQRPAERPQGGPRDGPRRDVESARAATEAPAAPGEAAVEPAEPSTGTAPARRRGRPRKVDVATAASVELPVGVAESAIAADASAGASAQAGAQAPAPAARRGRPRKNPATGAVTPSASETATAAESEAVPARRGGRRPAASAPRLSEAPASPEATARGEAPAWGAGTAWAGGPASGEGAASGAQPPSGEGAGPAPDPGVPAKPRRGRPPKAATAAAGRSAAADAPEAAAPARTRRGRTAAASDSGIAVAETGAPAPEPVARAPRRRVTSSPSSSE